MDPKVNYALVGLFVLIVGTALLATVFWLARPHEDRQYRLYYAYVYESVAGLTTNAPVKFRGVAVGEVKEIALDRDNPERVRLLLKIEEGTPVRTDTIAILSSQGVTGVAYVDLTGGKMASPELTPPPGQPYPVIRTGPSLLARYDQAASSLFEEVNRLVADLNNLTNHANEYLGGDGGHHIRNTLANTEKLTERLTQRVEQMGQGLGQIDIILKNTAKASNSLPDLTGKASASLASIEKAVSTLSHTADRVENLIQNSNDELSRFSRGTLTQLNPLLTELQRLTETLDRFVGDLERNPNQIIFGRPRPAAGPGEK
jgi:phospholipid/cholesterol/gamma-HCH transport system substrate-binding protein